MTRHNIEVVRTSHFNVEVEADTREEAEAEAQENVETIVDDLEGDHSYQYFYQGSGDEDPEEDQT